MSMGFASRMCIDSAALGVASPVYEYLSESLKGENSIVDTGGIRGTRSHPSERTRFGLTNVRGSIEFAPSPQEMVALMPWILGGTPVGNVYPLAETVPAMNVGIYRDSAMFDYAGVYVNKATFTGREGEPIKVALDLFGQTETSTPAGAFPSTAALDLHPPLMFMDGVLTLLSGARQFKDFTLSIDNKLIVQFNNSVTATRITAADRDVMLEVKTPFTSAEVDLYNQALLGAAGSLVLTNGADSLSFAFAALQFPNNTPVVPGKVEIPLEMRGVARTSGSTKELIVTLVAV